MLKVFVAEAEKQIPVFPLYLKVVTRFDEFLCVHFSQAGHNAGCAIFGVTPRVSCLSSGEEKGVFGPSPDVQRRSALRNCTMKEAWKHNVY